MPSIDSNTHRRAGQTLQTGEATMSLQSPLASLSSFSFVTSGALRALGTRSTDTDWVRLSRTGALCWPCPSQGIQRPQGPCCPPSLPLSETQHRTLKHSLGFPGLQPVLRVPWDLVRPVRREWEQHQVKARTGWPSSLSALGRSIETAAPMVLTASPRSPCLPVGPAGPGEPGGPGAPGAPRGPVSPRSPCQERGFRLREECSRRGKERRSFQSNTSLCPQAATSG